MNFRPKVNTLYVSHEGEFKAYFIIRKVDGKNITIDIFNPDLNKWFETKEVDRGWGNIRHKFRKVKNKKLKTKLALKSGFAERVMGSSPNLVGQQTLNLPSQDIPGPNPGDLI